ncbi:hypothetical protein AwDysgo_07980 [Bacteroidales bacterium]|nr:hypothetical protein AwDysgo_07980 [Bacteroidales bacterium]
MVNFRIRKNRLLSLFLVCSQVLFSQSALDYKIETFGSAATKNQTPFWILSNNYGVVPMQSANTYMRAGTKFLHNSDKGFTYKAGVDLVGSSNELSHLFLQQLYGEVEFKSLVLTAGIKETYNSMLDKELSSGDLNYSSNARPIPELRLSVPKFTTIPYTKGFFKFRGDFAVGKSSDNYYTLKSKNDVDDYALDVLWHHKSLFLLLEDPEQKNPFSITLGVDHGAQWGGWITWDDKGKMSESFSDFLRIMMVKEGGADAFLGDQINVLGNHQGTMNFKLDYKYKSLILGAYKQHYFDDKSGVEYANWRDGIWGLELRLQDKKIINKIVGEFINTTHQSGPFHFLNAGRPGRGGGNDDYYNHDYYKSGWSHWGRSLGSPLITSPEYNDDGILFFKNNRIKSWHLGLQGSLNQVFSYRILATQTQSWGKMNLPFLEKKDQFSSLLECIYENNEKYRGWKLQLQLALDQGALYGDNFACSLKISRAGSLLKNR